jgi:hypothetical protein
MKGGNTDAVYKVGSAEYDNRMEFTKSLYEQHPDCVTISSKWGRVHHDVDYSRFALNRPIPRSDLKLTGKTNEYGLRLVRIDKNLKPIELLDPNEDGFNVMQG